MRTVRTVWSGTPRLRTASTALTVFTACTVLTAPSVSAQIVAIGPQFVLADYRETSNDLHYRASGFGGLLTLSYHKLGADVAYARMSYDPSSDGDAIDGFTATQVDARLRYYVGGSVSVEAGVTSRTIEPDFTAQSAGAARVGVRLSHLVDPAVRLSLRGNYLAAAKFSGGGSAPFGLELGLGVSGDFVRGRIRMSADYEFQYYGRHTDDGSGEVDVPLQQAMLRLGVAGLF